MNTKRIIIGIMGSGDSEAMQDIRLAKAFAVLVAKRGWTILTGGRPVGVMRAAHEGAKSVNGSLVVGILPTTRTAGGACALVDIPIYTGLGDGRNVITAQSPDVVVAFVNQAGPGTISEIALACKGKRPLLLVGDEGKTLAIAAALGATVAMVTDELSALRAVDSLLGV